MDGSLWQLAEACRNHQELGWKKIIEHHLFQQPKQQPETVVEIPNFFRIHLSSCQIRVLLLSLVG